MQHRVSEIRTLLPSDYATLSGDRQSCGPAFTPIDLALSDLWINGPRWLGDPAADDPIPEMPMPTECAVELKVKDQPAALNLLQSQPNHRITAQSKGSYVSQHMS